MSETVQFGLHKNTFRIEYITKRERWVNPLPDEASRMKREPEKKDPLRGSFFSYRPSAGAAPWSVLKVWNF